MKYFYPKNLSRGTKNQPSEDRPYHRTTKSSSRPSNYNNRPRRAKSGTKSGIKKPLDRRFFTAKPTETTKSITPYQGVAYSSFGLPGLLATNLAKKGFQTTTEIQEKAIPLIREGKDILGISATGSGKTGAFLIPMIEKLLKNPSEKLLVLAPTRELALQITKEAQSLLLNSRSTVSLVIGGESMRRQIQAIERGIDILVGTPGRINDLVNQKKLDLSLYPNIVVDEVDRMFDMGFIKDVQFIFDRVSKNRQSLFFSATLNTPVEKIVSSLSSEYKTIKLANNTPTTQVSQHLIDYTHPEEKIDLLKGILDQDEVSKVIIFVETKRYADKVQKILKYQGVRIESLHGDKRQNVRKRIIDLFKKSHIDVLIATNVAARGIDIDDITHVINLDTPTSYDEYIHRIGRTGRNGATGTAYTFIEK